MIIELLENKTATKEKSELVATFDHLTAEQAYKFHSSFSNYKPTPLIELKGLAKHVGVKNIWLKDESHRFGLKAFKVLGASYAVAKLLAEMFGLSGNALTFSIFNDPRIREKIKNITFVTATDGNHGRGVAWTAQQLGCKCVVYMPKKTTLNRFENIKSHNADVIIIDGDYDDASNIARTNAQKYGWLLIQDSSWNGYEKIPLWIMHGYLSLMREIFEQTKDERPTHFFVQCGVGSLPAAVLGYLVNLYSNELPIFVNVEPIDAGCVYESFAVNDGRLHPLTNEINTIMAGLACGIPSKLAWEILRNHSNFFVKCSDDIAVQGMKILGRMEFGDEQIVSGESGAVTTGLVFELLSNPFYKNFALQLQLNSKSKIFLISTEGDTDPDTYKKLVS